MTELTAADLLAERLYAAGCRTAFGMPGGEVLHLIGALERAGIEFVLTRHETGAGFIAEGVWHRTGAPGILVATLGPGAMNAANVMANAWQDRVPLILLTGAVDADEAQSYTHQVMDHGAVFSAISKGSFTLTAGAADIVADRAVATALAPRPGPVHVDVPISVAETPVTRPPHTRLVAPGIPLAPAPSPDLDRARDWLAAAEQPVMLIGLDALDDGPALRAFVESRGIPFVTTYKAKGVIPEDHPLCLGGAGLSPKADAILLPLFREADLVLLAGYDPMEMRVGWREVWDPSRQNVIDIAAERNTHYMHQSGLTILAQVGPTLATLADVPVRTAWDVTATKAKLADAFPEGEDWGPAAVVAECRTAFPADTLASVDSGAHRILLSQMWRCSEARGLVQSTGLCTMGCAVPLAVGMKRASPERPVVAFTGDAGLLMIAGELGTLADLGLPVTIVVFVDQSLALIEKKQRERQMPNQGVDFGPTDFVKLAEAFGGTGVTVRDRPALRRAIEGALESDRFTIIAAEIDRRAYDGRI